MADDMIERGEDAAQIAMREKIEARLKREGRLEAVEKSTEGLAQDLKALGDAMDAKDAKLANDMVSQFTLRMDARLETFTATSATDRVEHERRIEAMLRDALGDMPTRAELPRLVKENFDVLTENHKKSNRGMVQHFFKVCLGILALCGAFWAAAETVFRIMKALATSG